MNFVKGLCIKYMVLFIFGLTITIISNINPYFLVSTTFSLLVLLFYILLSINLSFTIVYVISRPRANIKNHNECFDVKGYKIIICHLCDYYLKCKERKKNESNS